MNSLIRYALYPLTMGLVMATALAAAAGNVMAWPTLPAMVAFAIGTIAYLERRLPFEPAWLTDKGDGRADITHGLVNWGLLSTAGWVTHALMRPDLGRCAVAAALADRSSAFGGGAGSRPRPLCDALDQPSLAMGMAVSRGASQRRATVLAQRRAAPSG